MKHWAPERGSICRLSGGGGGTDGIYDSHHVPNRPQRACHVQCTPLRVTHASLERRLLHDFSRRSYRTPYRRRSADMALVHSVVSSQRRITQAGENQFFEALDLARILTNALPLFFSVYRPFRSELLRTSPGDI